MLVLGADSIYFVFDVRHKIIFGIIDTLLTTIFQAKGGNELLISRIDHISIAVKDFEKAKSFFLTIFGAVSGAAEEDPRMKYFWNIFSLGDLSRLEIIKATGQGSFLENFLSTKKDGGVHHITLETSDIKAVKSHLEENQIPFFGYSDHNEKWKELFIHPKDAFGILIQVAQLRDPNDYLPESILFKGEKPWRIRTSGTDYILSFAHPGGGSVEHKLTARDMIGLAEDIHALGIQESETGGHGKD
ncbi:MAG: hypothetical protein FP816_17205 [Desulfobacteraceae bacterium]|nr:hypothetical protein [Desulfobacteraceae bacterium]